MILRSALLFDLAVRLFAVLLFTVPALLGIYGWDMALIMLTVAAVGDLTLYLIRRYKDRK